MEVLDAKVVGIDGWGMAHSLEDVEGREDSGFLSLQLRLVI
jgi:hypothetical protein